MGKGSRPGAFICHRCESRGDLVTLVMRSQGLNRRDAESRVGEAIPYFRMASKEKRGWERPDISEWAPYRSTCSSYLLEKGFDEDWIWHYGIGFDRWSGEVVIPTTDAEGDLVGITRRLAKDGQPYYHSEFPKSEFIWGLRQAIDSGEGGAYVVEGQTDPLGLSPHVDLPVVSTLGCGMSEIQASILANHFSTIVLAYDNDWAGYIGADRAVPIMRAAGCHDLFLLDYNAGDPGKLPEVDEPELEHMSYLAWRRRKELPPLRKRRNYGTKRK